MHRVTRPSTMTFFAGRRRCTSPSPAPGSIRLPSSEREGFSFLSSICFQPEICAGNPAVAQIFPRTPHTAPYGRGRDLSRAGFFSAFSRMKNHAALKISWNRYPSTMNTFCWFHSPGLHLLRYRRRVHSFGVAPCISIPNARAPPSTRLRRILSQQP